MSRRKRELILALLREHGEMYGLDLVRKSGGVLSRGVVYIDLGELLDRGEIEARIGPDMRRLYRLVPGRLLLETFFPRLVSCFGATNAPTQASYDIVRVRHFERLTEAHVVSRQVCVDGDVVDWQPLLVPRRVHLTAVETDAVDREARSRDEGVARA